jgi:hypothetical protein
MTEGYLAFDRHFVSASDWVRYTWGYGAAGSGTADEMSLQIGVVQWLFILSAVTLVVARFVRQRQTSNTYEVVWWLAVVAFAMVMMTRTSRAVWETIGPMSFIQFPWRFMMLPALACAALAAHVVAAVRNRWVRGLLVPCLAGVLWYVSADYLALARDRPRNASAIDAADWGSTEEARATAFNDRGFDPARALYPPGEQSGRWSIVKGEGVIAAESVRDDELVLSAVTVAGMEIGIKSRYVPGWKAWVDGREAPLMVESEQGYMVLSIEPGSHRVRVAFTNTSLRMIANSVSGGSFIVGIAWLAGMASRRR